MKIVGLSIEGLRKIKAAHLEFDGKHLIQVRGENGAGKSTVLDAIKYLLKGTKEVPAEAVTHGERRAEIVGRIDQYIVKRTITPDGKSTLAVEGEGGKVAKPQDFLDTISGQFMDPQWFAGLPSKEKRSVVMQYLGIDFTEIDQKIKDAETERTIAGRELKAIGEPVPVEKVKSVSVSDLMAKRKEILEHNEQQMERGLLQRERFENCEKQ